MRKKTKNSQPQTKFTGSYKKRVTCFPRMEKVIRNVSNDIDVDLFPTYGKSYKKRFQ